MSQLDEVYAGVKEFDVDLHAMVVKADKEGFRTAVPTVICRVGEDMCRYLFGDNITNLAFNGGALSGEGVFRYKNIKPDIIWGVYLWNCLKITDGGSEYMGEFRSAPVFDKIEAADNEDVRLFIKLPFAIETYGDAFTFMGENMKLGIGLTMEPAPPEEEDDGDAGDDGDFDLAA